MSKIEAITGIAITIHETIKGVSELFKTSVEGNFYTALDKLTFLTAESLAINSNGEITDGCAELGEAIVRLSNLGIWGILIFYGFRSLFSYFLSKKVEVPWKFFIRMIIFGVFMNASFFICYNAVYIVEETTSYILDSSNINISFTNIENEISELDLKMDNEEESDIFTMEELLKIAVYFSLLALAIFSGARFLILRILILVSPMFFALGGSESTEKIFFAWIKYFAWMLAFQIFICICLGVFLNSKFTEEVISQILLISTLIISINAIKNVKKTINE